MTRQDITELQEDFPLQVNNNVITLYHATSSENAKQIIESQLMYGKENGLFFSSLPNEEISGYGNTIIQVEIPISKIELDDQFSNELHFCMYCKANTFYKVKASIYKKVNSH